MENTTINEAMSPSGSVSQYVPPKMWKDLTADEKIERMREQIKHLSYLVGNANGGVNDLKNDFQNHAHLDGKVVKDIKTYNAGLLGGVAKLANPEAEKNGEVYF